MFIEGFLGLVGAFVLEPEDIESISLGTIWNFSKTTWLP